MDDDNDSTKAQRGTPVSPASPISSTFPPHQPSTTSHPSDTQTNPITTTQPSNGPSPFQLPLHPSTTGNQEPDKSETIRRFSSDTNAPWSALNRHRDDLFPRLDDRFDSLDGRNYPDMQEEPVELERLAKKDEGGSEKNTKRKRQGKYGNGEVNGHGHGFGNGFGNGNGKGDGEGEGGTGIGA